MEMRYKIREGIVMTHVCGVHMMVPLRVLREQKIPIRKIPNAIAMAIQMFSKGMSEQGTIDFIAVMSRNADKALLREKLFEAMEKLCEAGYLVKEEENPKQ